MLNKLITAHVSVWVNKRPVVLELVGVQTPEGREKKRKRRKRRKSDIDIYIYTLAINCRAHA